MGLALRRNREDGARSQPTPERLAKAGDNTILDDKQRRWMRDSPLERALSRHAITGSQYNAGVKYRHHWFHAGLAGSIASLDLGRVFAVDMAGFHGMAKSEAQAFHRLEYRVAVQHIGQQHSSIIERVVCFEEPLERLGYQLGWSSAPQAIAAATTRLQMALAALAEFWKT